MASTIWLIFLLFIMLTSFLVRWRFKKANNKALADHSAAISDTTTDSDSHTHHSRRMTSSQASVPYNNMVIAGLLGVFAASTVAFIVSLFFSMTYTQDQGDATVIRSWSGRVTSVDTSPGLGFKMPWERTVVFDVRNVVIEFVNKGDGSIGQDGPAISAPLSGSSNATVNFTATISIEPSCVGKIYEQYKSEANFRIRRLTPVVRDQVRNASTAYDPFKIKERREVLSGDIRTRLESEWTDDCVIIQDINLGDISLDPTTEQAITNVNVSRQQVEAARNSLEESKIQAEEIRVDAKAQADADQIIRCGAITSTEMQIIGGEEQEVTIITPKQGEECENLLNEQVLTAKWIDALTELGAAGNVTIVVPNDPSGGLDLQPRIDLPINTESSTEDPTAND